MKEWTVRQALFCLIGSTCFTLIFSIGGYTLWKNRQYKKLHEEKNWITTLVQTGPEKEALKSALLAEWLGLSTDKPISLYALDLKKAEQKLFSYPIFSSVSLKRLSNGALLVDYEVRRPVAWIADYANIAIDKEGYIFPVAPFFTPPGPLPEIYLGLPSFGAQSDEMGRKGGEWQTPLKNAYVDLAFQILAFLEKTGAKEKIRIKRIDVSNAFALSLGSREIVLFTEEELAIQKEGKETVCIFPKMLRLAPKDYPQQLSHFFILRKAMMEDYRHQITQIQEGGYFSPRIIDLRIPQLAFVEKG